MTTTATGQAVAPLVAFAYDVSGTATPVTATTPMPVAIGTLPTGATVQYLAGSANVANAIASAAVSSGANASFLAGFDLTGGGATAYWPALSSIA